MTALHILLYVLAALGAATVLGALAILVLASRSKTPVHDGSPVPDVHTLTQNLHRAMVNGLEMQVANLKRELEQARRTIEHYEQALREERGLRQDAQLEKWCIDLGALVAHISERSAMPFNARTVLYNIRDLEGDSLPASTGFKLAQPALERIRLLEARYVRDLTSGGDVRDCQMTQRAILHEWATLFFISLALGVPPAAMQYAIELLEPDPDHRPTPDEVREYERRAHART